MKRTITMLLVAVFVIAMIAAVSLHTQGYTYDTLEKLFNRMVESSADDNSIKIEFVNTVSDFSVHNETALTNTVDPTFQIRHTTTGTPANGIGLSMDYKQETSTSNEEIIARATSLMTDVTAASEDADYILSLMDAGAAAAERWRLDSGGGITQSGASAATNSVVDLMNVKHNTSGTAAAGIGIGTLYTQETAAGNDEVIGSFDFVTTDVTGASEDADFVLSLMDAGAAAAEVLRVTSDGVVALEGGATIDNATSATNLALAETNIGLTGVTTITGAMTVNGAVVVNETSADVDTRIESNDVSDALVVDAGLNTISHGTWDVYDYVKTTDQSYSLASTGRAGNFIQTVGEAATFHLMTELLTSPGAGAMITIKTGSAFDVTIDTEGAETIDGANSYALDATYEAVTLTNDGANWFILGGYLE